MLLYSNLYYSYHEFDFHAECKGMQYKNISKLNFQVERTFEQQGYISVMQKAYATP